MNDDERQHPPYAHRPTGAYAAASIEPSTAVRADLRTALIVVGGLLAGGFAAGMGYFQLTEKVSRLDERMNNVATKLDLAGITAEAVKNARGRLRHATIKCPRHVSKGEAVAVCELVLAPGED